MPMFVEPEARRLAMKSQWDALVSLVRGPEGRVRASERDFVGWLPLHWAAFKGAPLEVVRALLDAYPQGAQTTSSRGWLPLHLAASKGAPLEVVQALLDVHPRAVLETNQDSMTPLDEARQRDYPQKKTIALLTRYMSDTELASLQQSNSVAVPADEQARSAHRARDRTRREQEECERPCRRDPQSMPPRYIKRACQVTVKRLMKKAEAKTMRTLLADFGLSGAGTKEQLAEQLAEQLHYATDDED